MGKNQGHNVNDNVPLEEKDNVNDNESINSYVRRIALENISEYRLTTVQDFLFKDYTYGSCKNLINPAIRQIEQFIYTWYTGIDEIDRKVIVGMCLEYDGDDRSRPYKDYTESPLWKFTSSIIKTLRGFTCEVCKKEFVPTALIVHHKTYKHMGSELQYPEDLQLVCKRCHMDIHGIERTK